MIAPGEVGERIAREIVDVRRKFADYDTLDIAQHINIKFGLQQPHERVTEADVVRILDAARAQRSGAA